MRMLKQKQRIGNDICRALFAEAPLKIPGFLVRGGANQEDFAGETGWGGYGHEKALEVQVPRFSSVERM